VDAGFLFQTGTLLQFDEHSPKGICIAYMGTNPEKLKEVQARFREKRDSDPERREKGFNI